MHWRDFLGAKGAWEGFLLLQLGGRCGPDIRHCLRTAALLLLLKCNTHVAVQWNLATLKHHSALPCQVQPGNILSAFVAPGAMICFPWAMIGCAWQPLDEMQGIQQEQSNATTAIFCISKIFLLRDFVGVFYFLAIPRIILLNGWDSGGQQ